MADDVEQLREAAKQMRAKLDGRVLDNGWINHRNMATFVDGCLALTDERERVVAIIDKAFRDVSRDLSDPEDHADRYEAALRDVRRLLTGKPVPTP